MRITKWLMLAVMSLVLISCEEMGQSLEEEFDWYDKVGAKRFPEQKDTFSANDFGAVADAKTLNTQSIQSAIDACAEKGGGIVAFEPGEYLTGSMLFENTTIKAEDGKAITVSDSKEIKF